MPISTLIMHDHPWLPSRLQSATALLFASGHGFIERERVHAVEADEGHCSSPVAGRQGKGNNNNAYSSTLQFENTPKDAKSGG
jgi:hypothetical protein